MAQLFHRYTNTLARLSIVLVLGGVVGTLVLFDQLQKSSYVTEVDLVKSQPVPFSHHHHVSGVGIDCRYCHTSAAKSSYAGIPPTSTCMNCHSQIFSDAPILEPVREAYRTGKAIPWVKVHDLPDFVYFNHSIHVAKGVGCTTCHGQVNEMPLTVKKNTLYMGWCLECHRNPEKFLRNKADVFKVDWKPGSDQIHYGNKLIEQYHVTVKNTDCSVCHH